MPVWIRVPKEKPTLDVALPAKSCHQSRHVPLQHRLDATRARIQFCVNPLAAREPDTIGKLGRPGGAPSWRVPNRPSPHQRANFYIADKRHDDLVRVAPPTIGYAEIGVGDPQFVKGHETGARGFMQEEFVAYR